MVRNARRVLPFSPCKDDELDTEGRRAAGSGKLESDSGSFQAVIMSRFAHFGDRSLLERMQKMLGVAQSVSELPAVPLSLF